jgi:carbamoyl-phosphate synthase large subunit
MPRAEIAETCFDKYKTFQYLREANFDTAKTYIDLRDAIADIQSGTLSYPVFVKPRCGFGSQLTFRACNEPELVAFFHCAPDMIIQEELTGDACCFDILNDMDGKVLSVVPWRKFRSRSGETEQAQTMADKALTDFGVRLSTALGHAGPLDADLFRLEGRISVLEINLRFGGGYPVSHLAGADFPAKIVKMIRGEKLVPDIGDFENDVVMMKDNSVIGGPGSQYFADRCVDWRETRT